MNPTQFASLTLRNCTFEYFFRDYEALIYVENNNMQIQNMTAAENANDPKNLMIYGDDRGANIFVQRSTFTNSRFCKGLIVYERLPDLTTDSDSSNAIINLADEFRYRYPGVITAIPTIVLAGSNLSNLNMYQTITKLSYGEEFSTIAGLDSIKYPYPNNRGSVINLNGFPGEVLVYNNTIEKNFAYIPSATTQREVVSETIEFSNF